MKFYFVFVAAILLSSLPCIAQDNASDKDKAAAYEKAIDTRAQKIVANLGITDSSRIPVVKNIIADQYKALNDIYERRDLKIKKLKEIQLVNKDSFNTVLTKINEATNAEVAVLHKKYIAALSHNLTPAQVDLVKDGMTYNVLHVTYNGYNQMIRTLTEPQKKQIMAWLVEARELAMDAESAEKKHAWFGKYKGRINNYLSAAGYDLKKEGEDWEKRNKEAAARKNNTTAQH